MSWLPWTPGQESVAVTPLRTEPSLFEAQEKGPELSEKVLQSLHEAAIQAFSISGKIDPKVIASIVGISVGVVEQHLQNQGYKEIEQDKTIYYALTESEVQTEEVKRPSVQRTLGEIDDEHQPICPVPSGENSSKGHGKISVKPQADSLQEEAKPAGKLKILQEKLPYTLVRVNTDESWQRALEAVEKAGICGLDLETTGIDPLTSEVRLAQIAIPTGEVFVADLWQLEDALKDLAALIENEKVTKIAHNAKFELSMIQAASKRRLYPQNIFCTMLASQLVWSGYYDRIDAWGTHEQGKVKSPKHSLEDVVLRHLGLEMEKSYQISDWSQETLSEGQIDYAALDAVVLLPLHKIFKTLLEKNGLVEVAALEFGIIPSVVEIEMIGLSFDIESTKALLDEKNVQVEALIYELQQEAQAQGFIPRPKKSKNKAALLNPASTVDGLDFLKLIGHEVSSTKEEILKEVVLEGCTWAGVCLIY